MNHTTLPNSSRVSRLKKRFLDVLSGSVKLDPHGATLFLEGLCAQDDPVVCLNAITDSAYGLPSVQSAMQFDLSVQFMNGLGSAVLEYLLRTSDVGGGALDDILFHVVEPPIFWSVFVLAFQEGTLSEDAQLVFARLLSRLLTLQNRDTVPYRDIAAQPFIQNNLVMSPKHEIREIGHLIKHILSSAGPVTMSRVLSGPGGRHDNDFADYRDIAILPTADEILCQSPPFLLPTFHDELGSSETAIRDYLDNAFRMLREDMLFDIREEIQAAFHKKGKHRGLRTIGTVAMMDIYTGTHDRKSSWGIKLQCSTDLKKLKKLQDEDARVKFLRRDPHGSRILRHQSLVCLISGQDIISFGTVNRVEELLACIPPVIVLQLDGTVNTQKTLISLCTTKDVELVQISTATFSFEPVLAALKRMDSIPLAKEILFRDPETPLSAPRTRAALSHIANAVNSDHSINLKTLLDLPTSIRLDKSQATSLITGLTRSVSLIQGPPGTGKSFIGTILAKAIHDKTSQTILVVCYTNHALDQFLGDLLKYNIPATSMVRLGGRASQSTEHLSLQKQPHERFRYDWDTIKDLKEDASDHESSLDSHFSKLLDDSDTNLINYLEQDHREFFDAFHVPPEDEDGMIRVGRNGQAIDERYLFSRWMGGLDAGVLSGEPHVQASSWIWAIDHSARQQLLATWWHELISGQLEAVCHAGRLYNRLQDTIKREFAQSTVSTLRKKRIIACTTTGAANYAEALEQVGPGVLLVEEAGEILESHVLTALSRKVNQMILIGDHKQLRPKVNNYRLTVEKGEGFDLNRSLFERLILKGYPHEMLSTQHRMRPEISAFVRELTYPELVDAPSTLQRANIRGIQSNIVFLNHTHPEDDDALVGDRADGGAKTSKQNTYEVQMVLKIVRYLAQQGYKGEDMVVLTPYLGQLHQLRDALKHNNDPILSELDALDLARAGISPLAPAGLKSKKGGIHLATIDNYQGEESNIVVASLTRSNKSNAIGFMDSPERLNVLLSRARDGLILIGNAKTFLQSKKGGALWGRFFALLDKGQYIYQGFPVGCERHPERVVLLKRASDFDNHCPDGGCTELCGFMLSCGHVCPMKCHPRRTSEWQDPHDPSQCEHKMSDKCPAGIHNLAWECGSGRPSVCSACDAEVKRLEEIARQALEQQQKREEAEIEHRRQMAELEATLRAVEVAEKERKRQEEQRIREEALKRQKEEEEKRKREERMKRKDEEKKRKEENKKRKEENKKRKEENKKEMRRKQEERAKRLQEAARQRREEDRRRQEEETRKRVEETSRLQEAAHRKREEEERRRQEEVTKKREEETKRLQEATRRRQVEEERRRHEEVRKRREEMKRLQEATRRRQEEEECRRQEEDARTREEQARRLQEATHRRQDEERRRGEEDLQKREEAEIEHCGQMVEPEATLRAVEAAEKERKCQEEQRVREEALKRQKEEEEKRKREEKKKRKEERKKRKEEKKKEKKEKKKKREEKKRKQEEKAKRLQEAARQRQNEEMRKRLEETRRLQEVTKKREEETKPLQEPAHKWNEEEERKRRQEEIRQMQEANRRRLEERKKGSSKLLAGYRLL